MKNILVLLAFYVNIISCESNKDNYMSKKEFYYSLKYDENILLTTNYDTLITNKGVFPVKDSLDDEKSNIYHLIYKNRIVGNLTQNPIDDKDSIIKIYIDSTLISGKNSGFDLYKMNTNKMSKLSLNNEKKDFLKNYRLIK